MSKLHFFDFVADSLYITYQKTIFTAKKTTFNMAAVRHLFKTFHWLHVVIYFQISSKSDDFSLRYGELTICNIGHQ